MTKLSGWGNYPTTTGTIIPLSTKINLANDLKNTQNVIAQGNSRSYGDSALSEQVINTRPYALFEDFDQESGELTVQAGALLEEILEAFVPRGWFLAITPGTKLITVGGAIASDVHGKNHHIEGCFSESVINFELMQDHNKVIICDRKSQSELFRATCGGQGLTGIILKAKIKLTKIHSQTILQSNFKTHSLKETIDTFHSHADSSFSVAWLDCTATGTKLGRAHVSIGEFSQDGNLNYSPQKKFNIPFYLPSIFLNPLTLKLFNLIYYHRQLKKINHSQTSIDRFFYPLDSIKNWNRLYGKLGFVQYQFVLPLETSFDGLHNILSIISDSKKGSFLAVLKLLGEENENYLSFPMKGFTLALDFKVEKSLFPLLASLDEEVKKHNGRIYLAKDARIDKTTFATGYPKINKFRNFRYQNKLHKTFNSLQAKRLDL